MQLGGKTSQLGVGAGIRRCRTCADMIKLFIQLPYSVRSCTYLLCNQVWLSGEFFT